MFHCPMEGCAIDHSAVLLVSAYRRQRDRKGRIIRGQEWFDPVPTIGQFLATYPDARAVVNDVNSIPPVIMLMAEMEDGTRVVGLAADERLHPHSYPKWLEARGAWLTRDGRFWTPEAAVFAYELSRETAAAHLVRNNHGSAKGISPLVIQAVVMHDGPSLAVAWLTRPEAERERLPWPIDNGDGSFTFSDWTVRTPLGCVRDFNVIARGR